MYLTIYGAYEENENLHSKFSGWNTQVHLKSACAYGEDLNFTATHRKDMELDLFLYGIFNEYENLHRKVTNHHQITTVHILKRKNRTVKGKKMHQKRSQN